MGNEVTFTSAIKRIESSVSYPFFYNLVHNNQVVVKDDDVRWAVVERITELRDRDDDPFMIRCFNGLLEDIESIYAPELLPFIGLKPKKESRKDLNDKLKRNAKKRMVERLKDEKPYIDFNFQINLNSFTTLKDIELMAILTVLKEVGYHKAEAAKILGITTVGMRTILIRNGYYKDGHLQMQ